MVIQVVPDAGYFAGDEGPFEIASGPGISDTVIMVALEDHTSDEPSVAGKAIALFEHIRGYALTVAESRKVMTEAIEQWKARQK